MHAFSGVEMFVRVAETLNFAEAGRRMGVSASAVGKGVARLEQRLGVQLFLRSTRAVTLTDKGEVYLSYCRQALDSMEEGKRCLLETQDALSGRLRIGMPLVCSPFQGTLIEFVERFPDLQLELDFSDRFVDVIEEGFDLVVRTGRLMDSRLMSRNLGHCNMRLVASPSYLDRVGRPAEECDLADKDCLRFRASTSGRLQPWPVSEKVSAQLNTKLTCSHVEMLHYAARSGTGIANLPDFLVDREIENGVLEIILEGKVQAKTEFHLIWPSSSWRPRKLSVAIDFLAENLLSPQGYTRLRGD